MLVRGLDLKGQWDAHIPLILVGIILLKFYLCFGNEISARHPSFLYFRQCLRKFLYRKSMQY